MTLMRPGSGPLADPAVAGTPTPAGLSGPLAGSEVVSPSEVTRLAGRTKGLIAEGLVEEAHQSFGDLVALEQRRASRLAYWYLRNAADADDAVQDAFVRAFMHLDSYREDLPFEVWFTRILVNGCFDRRKMQRRRDRWMVSGFDTEVAEVVRRTPREGPPSPEHRVIAAERRQRLSRAIDELPDRQRTVLLMCHHEGRTTREVGTITGLSEATVRVHLHRAIRRLRKLLEDVRDTR